MIDKIELYDEEEINELEETALIEKLVEIINLSDINEAEDNIVACNLDGYSYKSINICYYSNMYLLENNVEKPIKISSTNLDKEYKHENYDFNELTKSFLTNMLLQFIEDCNVSKTKIIFI